MPACCRQVEELRALLALEAVEIGRRHFLLQLVGARQIVHRADEAVLEQRSRFFWLQCMTSTISPASARVSMVG
jgi:hypothetical protein